MGTIPANAATTSDPRESVALVCTVAGLPKHRGVLTEESICARFSLRIREALERSVRPEAQLPASPAARWIKLEVKLLPRDRAEARLTSRLHGNAMNHPVMAVQVMDKSMDLDDIDKLARLVGRTLAES